jgi:large subunit ribosomal protein L11
VGSISKAKIEEIAKLKMVDLNTSNLAAAMKTIEGTAKSMGLTIE